MSLPAPYCDGCGRRATDCATGGECRGEFEPPRFCAQCGKRLRVLIIPTGWTATCRTHGEISL